eukprot:4639578-Pyramimonas_sp.AAC.1
MANDRLSARQRAAEAGRAVAAPPGRGGGEECEREEVARRAAPEAGPSEDIDPEAVSRYLEAAAGSGQGSEGLERQLRQIAREDSRRAGGRADEGYAPELLKLVDAAVVASVAKGTKATYGVAWRQWT